jgi:hypothetical protein
VRTEASSHDPMPLSRQLQILHSLGHSLRLQCSAPSWARVSLIAIRFGLAPHTSRGLFITYFASPAQRCGGRLLRPDQQVFIQRELTAQLAGAPSWRLHTSAVASS